MRNAIAPVTGAGADLVRARSPALLDALARLGRPLLRAAFRYRLLGLEILPPPPCLVVGNHSGNGTVEILCLASEWHRAFGEARPAHGLTSDIIDLALRPLTRRIGALPASWRNGLEVIHAGRDCLVFPGGELDSFRPFHAHREVWFGERRGYVKLALAAGVPVVPLATIGSHFTCPMAPGGRELACVLDALGLKRFLRIDSVPLPILPAVGLAGAATLVASGTPVELAAAVALASLLPLPVRITSRVLPAIDLARELPESLGPEERIEAGHRLIHGALARAVREMRHE
jgi:1-acyl-sn-glycerol-3-phosphate acyltransferase